MDEQILLSVDHRTDSASCSTEARQAAQFGDHERLRRLLDSGGVSVNCVDSDDCSLLHWAAINDRYEVAELLIRRKCDVNAVGGVLSSTPLHWASRHGHARIVALLVRNGADWTMRDVEGFTPLHIAVQFGCTPVVAYLIAMGQSPDELDSTKMTPVIWAAYKVYSVDPLRTLVMLGADVEKQDGNYKNTPLHWAIIQGNHTAINHLLSLNVDLTAKNKDGETALDIARRKGDLLALKLLEIAGRDRGMLPSSCRQRLREDKRLARMVIFTLPLLALFSAALILNTRLDYITKTELLTGVALAVSLIFRQFARERRERSIQLLLFSLAIASKAFLTIGWLVYLHAIVPWQLQAAFLALLILTPYLFLLVCTSDPGYATVTHRERCQMIIDMTEDANWRGSFCSTCLIVRPQRSKHCQVCDKCTARFDHHCPWVNNCIGASNHRIFIVYLLLVNLSCGVVVAGCLIYWRDVCGQISSFNILYCAPWVAMLNFLACVYFLFMCVMSCMQAYQILTAMTTNERLNSHRYGHFHIAGNKLNVRSPFTDAAQMSGTSGAHRNRKRTPKRNYSYDI